MTRITVRRRKPRLTDSKKDFVKFFNELAVEFNDRANRLEPRLLSGGTSHGSPDRNVESPEWEIGDVRCFTDITEAETRAALVPLFNAYRRLARAQSAGQAAVGVKRARRQELAAQGLDSLLTALVGPGTPSWAEQVIDRWLEPMFAQCRWSEADHFGKTCMKPVPWTKSDVSGGRSITDNKE